DFRIGADPNARGDITAEYELFLGLGLDGVFADQPDTAVAARRPAPPLTHRRPSGRMIHIESPTWGCRVHQDTPASVFRWSRTPGSGGFLRRYESDDVNGSGTGARRGMTRSRHQIRSV
ncbi:MAG: hypothetical protein WA890_26200, partial [Micromonospora sp.]